MVLFSACLPIPGTIISICISPGWRAGMFSRTTHRNVNATVCRLAHVYTYLAEHMLYLIPRRTYDWRLFVLPSEVSLTGSFALLSDS